jgi:LPS export ABC transporter protein LptC
VNRILLLFIVLALAVTSAFMLDKKGDSSPDAMAGSFMEDVTVVNKGAGKHRWTLNAEEVQIPSSGKSSRMNFVTIDLPEHGMQVESDSGLYDLGNRNLTLTGNIEAKTDDYLIRTDSMHLDPRTGELSTPDLVVLEGRNFSIQGEGFKANSDKKVTFKNNVKAMFF